MLKYDKLIRPIAISIIRKNDSILAYERIDDITKEKFYRLVGGCIEFGELSRDALKREFQEELSLEIKNCKLLSTFESIFTFNTIKMHETVFLYASDFKDPNVYNKKNIEGLEGSRKFNAVWISVSDFLNEKYKIYPKEIVRYL
tara:strand:- start:212 stop:643 length:432 start_codon:yes stop_codon:yes gene_type:complete